MVDQTKLKLFTFIAIGLVSAVYIFSVIEHEDGLGKVCLILLVCLGLTLPIVILNFNDSTDKELADLRVIVDSLNDLLDYSQDQNESYYLLQTIKKEVIRTKDSHRLAHFKSGMIEKIYKLLTVSKSLSDKRILVGLDIINNLFEDEEVRNSVFEVQKFANHCIEEHMNLVCRILPPGLDLPTDEIERKETIAIKAITTIAMMSYNHSQTQDRFADRGAIAWIIDFCFAKFDEKEQTLVNVGIYGLMALIANNPGNKSELFRRQFLSYIEPLLLQFSNVPKVVQSTLSLLFLLLEDDIRSRYSVQEARQYCIHANVINTIMDLRLKVTDSEIHTTIDKILNVVSKDLS